jgi:hypothetical protein
MMLQQFLVECDLTLSIEPSPIEIFHASNSDEEAVIGGLTEKKRRSGLQSACDELIDKGAIITGE